ncbi:MAG: XRE family transcriptional regulator, partial [Chloroflexi bacterium]|nr:XRE family transcriptional regulator [Chloroflexota bacterium]
MVEATPLLREDHHVHDRRRYKVTDYRFGQLALTLREKAGLTQAEVAGAVGVSDRTIQHWEGGTAFPAAANLQKLIALYLQHGAFTPGHERNEAEAFWKQADESAARRKSLFDDNWFDRLLAQQFPEEMGDGQAADRAPAEEGSPHPVDWGEAPDAAMIVGRERELATLRQWVLMDRCRVVVLLGIGGIGKTTLATRFAQDAAPHFDFVVWRSLRHAPSLPELLTDCVQAFADDQPPPVALSVEHGIKLLLERLRARRCLLVLDDVESLFEAGSLAGEYGPEHGGYRLLFRRLGETRHRSCVLLTSREMPRELEALEGSHTPLRALRVPGLEAAAGQKLLEDRDIYGTPEDWDDLVRQYAGNPLALKIVAATVRDLFGGDLAAAIAAYKSAPIVNDLTVKQVLTDQFTRLSPQEQIVLRWLAIEREPVGLDELRADLAGAPPDLVDLLSSLRSLLRRSLIERRGGGAIFGLQPEVLDYVTRQHVAEVSNALAADDLTPLMSHALVKARSADYIRDSQRRMILQPVLDALLAHAGSVRHLEERLLHLVQTLRREPAAGQGYAGGNLVNLLVALRGHLRGVDCSDLGLRQAHLRDVDARDANLAGSAAGETVFTEPLETIVAATLSPDGRYMALGSFTGQIRVRRVADDKPLWTGRTGTRMAWAL